MTKQKFKTLLNSFKNKKILLVLALNTAFFLVTAGIVKVIGILSNPQIDKVNALETTTLQSEAQILTLASTLKGFITYAMITGIIFIILFLITWSLFQGLIYNILLKKKFTGNYFAKFLLLNTVWLIPWLALFYLIIAGGRIETVIISGLILIALCIHFTLILYTLYTKTSKFQIKQTLKIGITKLHHFIMPYLIIIFTYIIIQQLKMPYLTILLYLLFFSWVQNYTKDIVLEIQKGYDKVN